MGKIVRQGVAYCGSSDSAENIKYSDSKNVKEAIDEIKNTAMFIDSFDTNTGALNTISETSGNSGITKVTVTDATVSSGVVVVTDLIPDGKNAFAFIITGGTLQAHTAHIWKNLASGAVNITFRLWSDNTLVMSDATVSGILLCI